HRNKKQRITAKYVFPGNKYSKRYHGNTFSSKPWIQRIPIVLEPIYWKHFVSLFSTSNEEIQAKKRQNSIPRHAAPKMSRGPKRHVKLYISHNPNANVIKEGIANIKLSPKDIFAFSNHLCFLI